jgi:SAM-dependent methyltransferase
MKATTRDDAGVNDPHASAACAPTVTWPEPSARAEWSSQCPNCGSCTGKPVLLTVEWHSPGQHRRSARLLRCPTCTCYFFDQHTQPDYAEPALGTAGRVPFYLQQGAGIGLITRPLARIRKPSGSTYLEVGCGFGFGLDFGIQARSWQGKGIDPAPLSDLGKRLLGLNIELRYLEPEDGARFDVDVVMSSETIEHVPSPRTFADTLRSALKPDGILVLTTPNADKITPSTPPGALVPILSPGLHLVFQNARSLQSLL